MDTFTDLNRGHVVKRGTAWTLLNSHLRSLVNEYSGILGHVSPRPSNLEPDNWLEVWTDKIYLRLYSTDRVKVETKGEETAVRKEINGYCPGCLYLRSACICPVNTNGAKAVNNPTPHIYMGVDMGYCPHCEHWMTVVGDVIDEGDEEAQILRGIFGIRPDGRSLLAQLVDIAKSNNFVKNTEQLGHVSSTLSTRDLIINVEENSVANTWREEFRELANAVNSFADTETTQKIFKSLTT